jgi:hypothetical protein
MNFQLIEYKTPTMPISSFGIIPDLYVSDFLSWLNGWGCRVVRTEINYRTMPHGADELLSDLHAPRHWPSYRECALYVRDTVIMGER